MRELGITYPVLIHPKGVENEEIVNPSGGTESEMKLPRFDFTVQFCWQPKLPSDRRKEKKKEAEMMKAQQAAGGEQAPAQP